MQISRKRVTLNYETVSSLTPLGSLILGCSSMQVLICPQDRPILFSHLNCFHTYERVRIDFEYAIT